jgi:hypothetical protein
MQRRGHETLFAVRVAQVASSRLREIERLIMNKQVTEKLDFMGHFGGQWG